MDRYEYKLKMDQIRALAEKKEYETAVEIADSINWRKVKNVNALIVAGDVYTHAKRYEDAHEILLFAYDRSPIGRMIIYRLAELAVKMGDYEGAQEYYDEFVEIAPHDNLKYVLRYKLAKSKGVALPTQIAILEELKDVEYSEEWAFELARLYHRNNQIQRCIETCDELVLWFGTGNFVKKAMELKMLYQPLTHEQEVKYRDYKQNKDEMQELRSQKNEQEELRPQLDPDRFHTGSLQQELAKEVRKILPEEPEERPEAQARFREAPVNEQTVIPESRAAYLQSSAYMEESMPEPQIPGQVSMEDFMLQWEKTKQATELAIAEAQQRAEAEKEKAKEVKYQEDIMDRIDDVIPKQETKEDHALLQKIRAARPNYDEQIGLSPYVPTQFDTKEETNEGSAEEPEELPSYRFDTKEMPVIADILEEEPELRRTLIQQDPQEPEEEEIRAAEDEIRTEEITRALNEQVLEVAEEDVSGAAEPISCLDEELKKLFSYFVPVAGMESQICQVLTGASARLTGSGSSSTGNIMIQGGAGCGKTVLATSLVKALQKKVNRPNGKIGKIDAETLNKKDVQALLKKVSGGCLIIERAGGIDRETAVKLSILMEQDNSGLLVILEDTRTGIEKAMSRAEDFSRKFTEKIKIPVFTSDELVAFGKAYAKELEYQIDEMGVLALFNRISNIQRIDRATTLTEVKEIVDQAIEHVEKNVIKKAFSIVTSRRYNDDDYIILREKDFEE